MVRWRSPVGSCCGGRGSVRCPTSNARLNCSFGVWVWSPGTENAFRVCLYGRLLLALSLCARRFGNQEAEGWS